MTGIWKKRADEIARLKTFGPPEADDRPEIHGVLLADEIERLAKKHRLISPYDRAHLKPASYQLTVGNEYFLGGEYFILKDGEDRIVINPFEVAVLKTAETLCLPRYLIARWNIRVNYAYRGLLWVGGPQVDPGWVGHLYCPIYNLSHKEVTIRCGEEIAIIDFVKTTPFLPAEVEHSEHFRYPAPPKKVIIEDYGIDDLKSALFHHVKERVDDMEENVKGVEGRLAWFTQIVFTTLALVVASMSFLFARRQGVDIAASVWSFLLVAMSVAAFLLSLFNLMGRKFVSYLKPRLVHLSGHTGQAVTQFLSRRWQIGVAVTAALALVFAAFAALWTGPIGVGGRNLVLKRDLDAATEQLRQGEDRRFSASETKLMNQVLELLKQERDVRLKAEQDLRDAIKPTAH